MKRTRRELLAGVGVGTAALAGCVAPTRSGRQRADSEYTQVYRRVVPSVVSVRVSEAGTPLGQGSGFAIGTRTIVTNNHVVAPGPEVHIQFADGQWADASVQGTDVHSDLAVLNADSSASFSDPLSFVEEPSPVGEEILAIGAPYNLTDSLSRGVISGRGRSVPAYGTFNIPDAIQTDAALNPGSSGGPIVNLDGEVVGVVFAGQGETVGFAISAALARRVIPALIETGEYEHAYLGVSLIDVGPAVAAANDLAEPRGALIVDTAADSPAAGTLQASEDGGDSAESASGEVPVVPDEESPGERPPDTRREIPTGGDVIVDIDGTRIIDTNVLSRTLALKTRPGDTVPITIIRDGTEQVVDVTLGAKPTP